MIEIKEMQKRKVLFSSGSLALRGRVPGATKLFVHLGRAHAECGGSCTVVAGEGGGGSWLNRRSSSE